jgi:hypothetical protein
MSSPTDALVTALVGDPSVRRRFFFVRQPLGLDAPDTLADELVCLDTADALFGEVTLRRAHLLPFGRTLEGHSLCAPHMPIPEIAEHWTSLSPPTTGINSGLGQRPLT